MISECAMHHVNLEAMWQSLHAAARETDEMGSLGPPILYIHYYCKL